MANVCSVSHRVPIGGYVPRHGAMERALLSSSALRILATLRIRLNGETCKIPRAICFFLRRHTGAANAQEAVFEIGKGKQPAGDCRDVSSRRRKQ